jgi:1-acyl-sn-glycerol-3-phosphate acyltransferase
MDIQVKAKSMWLFYFGVTIVVIGGVMAYTVVIPLYLAGYFLPPAAELADRLTRNGIRFLMSVQPWFCGEIDLDLPHGGKGCLLVSNHRSHLDAFILLSRIQGVRILAKSSLFYIPFLGMMMRLTKQIPVERGNVQSFLRAIDLVGVRISQGEVAHVFPEMHRCEGGFEGTQNFSIAPFHMAKVGGFPVIPIVFQGTDDVWPKSSLSLRFRRQVRVRSLQPLNPKDFSSSEELLRETRRRIDQALLA